MSERFGSRRRRGLAFASRVVDSLSAAGCGELAFRMGGPGPASTFDHRTSNGVALFIDDARALGFPTPRANDVAACLTHECREAANALKLVLTEGGIDFVEAGAATRRVRLLPLRRLAVRKRAEPSSPAAGIAMIASGQIHFDGMVDRAAQAIEQFA